MSAALTIRLMDNDQVKRIVEAAILAAGQPLSMVQLTALFGDAEPVGSESVAQAIEALREDYAGRGIELTEVASGFRFQVRGDVHPFVARLWTERPSKYSRALLETLALVAYRQPITRAEIEQIRGVAVSSNIIRTLEEREWIRVVGHRDVPGKPALFGTTRQFLDYFGLRSLDELPPLAEIRDLEELDPQLSLPDSGTTDAAAVDAASESAEVEGDEEPRVDEPETAADAANESADDASAADGAGDPQDTEARA